MSVWLDAELDSLEALLDLMYSGTAATEVAAFRGLHLDANSTPEKVGQLLVDAQATMERLLDRRRANPFDVTLAGPTPRDFDA